MRRLVPILTLLLATLAGAQSPHVLVRVTLAPTAPTLSGRILVFFKQGTTDKTVDVDPFAPSSTWVAAKEVHDLAPGTAVEIDGSDLAYPASFSTMPSGDWEAQAILDVDHTYNYSSRGPDDWTGPVVVLKHWSPTGPEPTLTLAAKVPEDPRMAAMKTDLAPLLKPGIAEQVDFPSPALSKFWGRPTFIQAWVILPPGYAEHPTAHYPTAYWNHGFEGNLDYAMMQGLQIRKRMQAGTMPPMIWVMLVEACPQGTHEFADSVNNGPWGTALTTEFIPMLEQTYRAEPRPTSRLLNGHSSGGWATLQLQVNYPQVFGGAWATSPDPSDFHDFTGTDLYAPHANLYRNAAGTATPIMRDSGKVVATMQQFAQLEEVIGPYGGQMASFDYVFSPRSASGAPVPMFDRKTGEVDPAVVRYWHYHSDLANIVETTWPQRGALLKGRIHLFVGTADTFYLDQSARLFEARLKKLGADPHFTYIPDRTHFDLYGIGKDEMALFDQIGTEMYATAHPGQSWKKP